jgi:hypothetical protein
VLRIDDEFQAISMTIRTDKRIEMRELTSIKPAQQFNERILLGRRIHCISVTRATKSYAGASWTASYSTTI